MARAERPERRYVYENVMMDSRRWDGFAPRSGDIIISTPPKCGTTWTQMICALLIFQTAKLERKLSDYTPWLDMAVQPIEEVLGVYQGQTHRRFIKTHTPLDGIPYFDEATYLFVARDPRDAFMSMGNHQRNTSPEMIEALTQALERRGASLPPPPSGDVRSRFRDWISASGVPEAGKPAELNVLHHAETFWAFRDLPNIHLLHYADLKADLDGEMRRLSGALGIPVDEARWPGLVAAASFEHMRENADALAPTSGHPKQWRDNARFFHKGEHGQWQGMLGDDELALFRAAMNRLPPDLAHWLEHGSRAGAPR